MKRTGKNKTKRAFVLSILSLILSLSMLIGTTFAWFTDSVTSANNRIIAGNLKVDLLMYKNGNYTSIAGGNGDIFTEAAVAQNSSATLWEPGKTQVVFLGVQNKGSLALKYNVKLNITDIDGHPSMVQKGFSALEFAIIDGQQNTDLSAMNWNAVKSAAGANVGDVTLGSMTAASNGVLDEIVKGTENETDYFALAVHMKEEAGNEFQNAGVQIDIAVVATQKDAEADSFGSDYDESADYPLLANIINTSAGGNYQSASSGDAAQDLILTDVTGSVEAIVPHNASIVSALNLSDGNEETVFNDDNDGYLAVSIKTTAVSNVSASYDISYIYTGDDGTRYSVAEFSDFLTNRLDIGSGLVIVFVTHSHENETRVMSPIDSADEQSEGFFYDDLTGILTIRSKTYSEFAVKFEDKIYVSSVTLDKTELLLRTGDTTVVQTTVLPENASNPKVMYSSSNPDVATVDESGNITAVDSGIATITATADGKSATCTVSVDVTAVNTTKNAGYATLAEAIADANAGDTIIISTDDNISSQLNVDKSLTIEAANPDVKPTLWFTTGDGTGGSNLITHGISISADNVTLKNLKLQVASGLVSSGNLVQINYCQENGEYYGYSDITIENCEFYGSDHCIATYAKNLTVKNCILDESTANDQGNIIYVWGTSGTLRIEGNTFIGKNNKKHGISFYSQDGSRTIADEIIITGNTFKDVMKCIVHESNMTYRNVSVTVAENDFYSYRSSGQAITIDYGTFNSYTVNNNIFRIHTTNVRVQSAATVTGSLNADNNYWGQASPVKSTVVSGNVTADIFYTDIEKTASSSAWGE